MIDNRANITPLSPDKHKFWKRGSKIKELSNYESSTTIFFIDSRSE